MSPTLLLTIIQAAITEAPALISTLETLFKSGSVTVEQIEALKASIAAESFAALAPNSEAQIDAAPPAAAPVAEGSDAPVAAAPAPAAGPVI